MALKIHTKDKHIFQLAQGRTYTYTYSWQISKRRACRKD